MQGIADTRALAWGKSLNEEGDCYGVSLRGIEEACFEPVGDLEAIQQVSIELVFSE